MDRDLRRSAYISGFAHLALIIAAIVTLPLKPLPLSTNEGVEVDLVGPSAPQESPVKAPGTASAKAPVVHQSKAISEQAPKKQPIEAPPPPPPPPPPTPKQAPAKVTATPTAPPPPPKPTVTPTHLPPPPPVKPQTQSSTTPTKAPPKPVKKPPATAPSATHQQHEIRKPQPLSQSVMNTLMNLRAEQKQTKPPTHVYNPDQSTAPKAGGSPNSTANSGLTGPDRAAIANHVRPCWSVDPEAQGLSNYQVLLTVTTDATGTVREAEVSPQNTGDMHNPVYYAFTQRAIAALLNAQCATLPLPSDMLGHNQTFTFLFQP